MASQCAQVDRLLFQFRGALIGVAFIASLILQGCGGPALGAPATTSESPSVSTPSAQPETDTRVSPHGKVRPTLAATTDLEDVSYYNPNTGTESEYTLEIDRDEDGTIERINFPNEGWLEIDGDVIDNGDGTETYTRDDGVEYTITRGGVSDSSDNNDSDGSEGDDSDSGSHTSDE